MDRHADRLSWQLTFAIRYPAVFAGDELPLLEVMAEAMHAYSRQDVLRLVLEPAVARARGDAKREIARRNRAWFAMNALGGRTQLGLSQSV